MFWADYGQEASGTEVLKDRYESDSIVEDLFPRLKTWEGTITENLGDKIFLLRLFISETEQQDSSVYHQLWSGKWHSWSYIIGWIVVAWLRNLHLARYYGKGGKQWSCLWLKTGEQICYRALVPVQLSWWIEFIRCTNCIGDRNRSGNLNLIFPIFTWHYRGVTGVDSYKLQMQALRPWTTVCEATWFTTPKKCFHQGGTCINFEKVEIWA